MSTMLFYFYDSSVFLPQAMMVLNGSRQDKHMKGVSTLHPPLVFLAGTMLRVANPRNYTCKVQHLWELACTADNLEGRSLPSTKHTPELPRVKKCLGHLSFFPFFPSFLRPFFPPFIILPSSSFLTPLPPYSFHPFFHSSSPPSLPFYLPLLINRWSFQRYPATALGEDFEICGIPWEKGC